MMDDQDEDFWATYIPATPEEDKDFAPMGKPLAWFIVALIAVAAVLLLR